MTKIIQRHDTAANWTSINPVLAAGEMGVEYQEGTVTFTLSDAVTTNGTPTFNNGLVSNFSTRNYYSMNTMLVEEMVIQFTTGSEITQGQYISTYPSLNIENGKLRLGLPSGFQQLMAVSASTQYTIKVINYSSKIEVYSSSTLIATFNTSLSSGGPRFGSNIDGYPFLGTIDFRNTSINGASLTNKTEVFSGTSRFKFGDGTTAWTSLAYAAGEGGSGSGTTLTSADGATTYSKLALGKNLVVDTGDIAWTNPAMTSNSMDGYVASASVSSSGTNPYQSFNGDTTTNDDAWYTGSNGFPQWIMLECPEPVRLTSCMIMNEIYSPENFKNAEIQGSNDGSTFDTLYTITNRPNTTSLKVTYPIETTNYYKYLRIYFTASYRTGVSIQEIEFSGFVKDKSAVPTLNVNLDELGNEVNTLANAVAGKQDKLTAEAPIKIYTDDNQAFGVTAVNSSIVNKTYTSTNDTTKYLESKDKSLNLAAYDSWEFRTKLLFNTNTTTAEQCIVSLKPNCFAFNIYGKSQLKTYLHSADTDFSFWSNTSINLSYNTVYYFKIQFTGSKYTIYYSTTGFDNMVSAASKSTTGRVQSLDESNLTLMQGSLPYNTAYGSTMYLEDTYFIGNGEVVWRAYDESKLGSLVITSDAPEVATSTSLGVVQPDGTSITVSETGIISGQDVKTFSGYSDTGTLVLKSINGVLQWVAEG